MPRKIPGIRYLIIYMYVSVISFSMTICCLLLNPVDFTGLLVRLANGSSYNEGRVEVNYDGEWGTVCDDGWDYDDAYVVCRQLGFGSSGTPYYSAYFGQGSGSILLDNVTCIGSESTLANCGHLGVGITRTCSHSNDAGVSCSIGGSNGYVHMYIVCVVCVYAYVYVCTCVHVSVYVCVYISVYMCVHVCMYVHTCVYVCVREYIYVCVCLCEYCVADTHMYICIYQAKLSLLCKYLQEHIIERQSV